MDSPSILWALILCSLHVSPIKHSGIISFGGDSPNNPLQVEINTNYMLTNQPTQMSLTQTSIGIVQTPVIPQIVSTNIAVEESLMIQYTSNPPVVTASMTPGTVIQTNNVTETSAQVDLTTSAPITEPLSSTVESVNISTSTIIVENTTSTIESATTDSTEPSSTLTTLTTITEIDTSLTTNSASTISLASTVIPTTPITTISSPISPLANTSIPSATTTATSFSVTIDSTNSSGLNDTKENAAPTTTLTTSGALPNSMNHLLTYLNNSVVGPMVGFVFPAEIKIYVNISMPAVSVNVTNVAPATPDDNIEVDIVEGNKTVIVRNDYVESTSEMVSGTTINIDLSYQNIDLGQPNPLPPLIPVTMSTTNTATVTGAPIRSRIYEQRCNQYYDIGSRRTRKTQVHVHIIGGTYTAQKEFPHMAALGYGKKTEPQWLCGGSLISQEYVITAAHCLSAKNIGDIQFVRLGTTTLQTETLESADYNVIARIPHPNYIAGKQYDDIALLRLDHPVDFTEYIAPICLTAFQDLTYAKLIATGWGKEDSGSVSAELQKVELDYVPRDVCQRGYDGVSLDALPNGIREESQLCAGSAQGSRDTCQGDSGGPLQMQQDGKMYLLGITSFGIGCGRPESPGVYTRVSYYIPWIESIVWGQ